MHPQEQVQQKIRTKFKIANKKKINHDCYVFDLVWDGPQFHLGIGQHFRIIQTIPTYDHPQGEQLVRKYTPISFCKNQQLIQLLVKIYRPNANPRFPLGGKLTPYLETLEVGATINVQGPYGNFNYKPGGIVVLNGQQHHAKRIFFIAGGSGITPCFQTINQIIAMPEQKTELILLFANKTQADIILKKQLQAMTPRLKLIFIVDVTPEGSNYLGGHINKEIMQSICPLNDPSTIYIHCGPPGMNVMIREVFSKNYPDSVIFKY